MTARELSLPEIRRIYDETGVEIESFIHGAPLLLLFRAVPDEQPVRRPQRQPGPVRPALPPNRYTYRPSPAACPYQVTDETGKVYHRKEKYPLSPKDLCAVETASAAL